MSSADLSPPLATRRLHAHPQTPCHVVDEVVVDVGVEAGDVLVVGYAIAGDLDRLRIPTSGAGLDPERLWAHTCCEMFVAPAAGAGYVEWNFSPSGQIARFEFSAYRQRTASASTTLAAPAVTVEGRALRLEARVPLPAHARVHIGLTAVIEDATGALSYWALRHPRDRPDFHDVDGLALALTLGPPIAIVDR